MYKSIFILSVSVCMIGIVLTSCNSSAENVKEKRSDVKNAEKELEQAEDKYMTDVALYKKEKAEDIAANEKDFAAFKAKNESDKKDAKDEYQTKITELERQNLEMKVKMNNYKPTGEQNWNKFKREFSHDMDELGNAFKDLTVNNRN